MNRWKLYRVRDRGGRTLRSFVVVEGKANDAFLDQHAPTETEVGLMQTLVDRHNREVETYERRQARGGPG